MRRQVVVEEELMEAAVHPNGVYAKLVRAFDESATALLRQEDSFRHTECTSCGGSKSAKAFEKKGFTFQECLSCGSLFTSPRPTTEQMEDYLRESAAAKFRASEEYRTALAERARELAHYRADWIASLCERVGPQSGPIVIFEPRGPELMESVVAARLGKVTAVRPLFSADPTAGSKHGWQVADDLGSEQASGARLVAVFDVLERQTSPAEILRSARVALGSNGCLAMTTRCGGGFDIQVAWDRATVFPLEHMNLPTVEGMESLLGRLGYNVVELSTPGQLDVQMVERLVAEDGVELPRFVRYLLRSRDQHAKQRLQQFLQENLLSSHLRVVARRANEEPTS